MLKKLGELLLIGALVFISQSTQSAWAVLPENAFTFRGYYLPRPSGVTPAANPGMRFIVDRSDSQGQLNQFWEVEIPYIQQNVGVVANPGVFTRSLRLRNEIIFDPSTPKFIASVAMVPGSPTSYQSHDAVYIVTSTYQILRLTEGAGTNANGLPNIKVEILPEPATAVAVYQDGYPLLVGPDNELFSYSGSKINYLFLGNQIDPKTFGTIRWIDRVSKAYPDTYVALTDHHQLLIFEVSGHQANIRSSMNFRNGQQLPGGAQNETLLENVMPGHVIGAAWNSIFFKGAGGVWVYVQTRKGVGAQAESKLVFYSAANGSLTETIPLKNAPSTASQMILLDATVGEVWGRSEKDYLVAIGSHANPSGDAVLGQPFDNNLEFWAQHPRFEKLWEGFAPSRAGNAARTAAIQQIQNIVTNNAVAAATAAPVAVSMPTSTHWPSRPGLPPANSGTGSNVAAQPATNTSVPAQAVSPAPVPSRDIADVLLEEARRVNAGHLLMTSKNPIWKYIKVINAIPAVREAMVRAVRHSGTLTLADWGTWLAMNKSRQRAVPLEVATDPISKVEIVVPLQGTDENREVALKDLHHVLGLLRNCQSLLI